VPSGFNLYRFESEYNLGTAVATEGYWFYVDTAVDPSRVMDTITGLVSGWFTEPVPATGISRADLMPREALYRNNKVLTFAADLVAIESELYSSIFSLTGTVDETAVPAIVSKEIEVHGAPHGRGRFNRVHTAFFPVSAVDPTDVRFMTVDYQAHLVQVYGFLFDLINQTSWFTGPIGHHFEHFATVAYVNSVRGAGNSVVARIVYDATDVRSSSLRWGTMRRRGAVVQH